MVAKSFILSALFFAAQSSVVYAQSSTALIDRQLLDQIDFRDAAFSVCFEQRSCEVGVSIPRSSSNDPLELTVAVAAERDTGILEGWQPAELYWDPVDGFGVLGGGQNDEIDFNERLTISLSEPLNIQGMWFSDMFIGEQSNYGVSYTEQEDLEAADVVASLTGVMVFERRVTGQVVVPDDPFNVVVSDDFVEGGDARNRVLIDEGIVTFLIEDETQGSPRIIRAAVGEIDPSKLDIFAGAEIVDIDPATLLGETEFAPLLAAGLRNQLMMERMVTNQINLAAWHTEASRQRLISSVPNGEVGTVLNVATTVDQLVFSAELMTSNDYSVAGLVVEN
ncbi:hypothetical protein FTO60_09975 [Octadecabacter sp. SW4]|uniref:hypothetical protein n=1 Tax=Octadecabacter sp. SW4 TaxID=2602067 RepID=UPI0011C1E268|nr:hypothetical protein [Octadecabacter sp. SW4]QEE36009.1 hypothetical protein FTO60_09975 [Octadecabacter sp. SW4]